MILFLSAKNFKFGVEGDVPGVLLIKCRDIALMYVTCLRKMYCVIAIRSVMTNWKRQKQMPRTVSSHKTCPHKMLSASHFYSTSPILHSHIIFFRMTQFKLLCVVLPNFLSHSLKKYSMQEPYNSVVGEMEFVTQSFEN